MEAATREGTHPVSGKAIAAPALPPTCLWLANGSAPASMAHLGSARLVLQAWGVQEEGTGCWVVRERSENRGRMLRAPLGGQWVQRRGGEEVQCTAGTDAGFPTHTP